MKFSMPFGARLVGPVHDRVERTGLVEEMGFDPARPPGA